MKPTQNGLEDFVLINQIAWDNRVKNHIHSDFYDLESFKKGENPLNTIELELLGSVQGLDILHLQCHFGMDTLALARLGARVTGIDFSAPAIEKARELAAELALPATFFCCDVYDTLKQVATTFDMVFTTYGTIGWLPDLDRWAEIIAGSLKPGGRLVFVEFHPVIWMFDNQFQHVAYSYFNSEAIVEEASGSYADRSSGTAETTISWNHSLHEVLEALLCQGLKINGFKEYDYSPYPCFENLETIGERKYQITGLNGKIPMVYSVVAEKI